ncbi:hypothetical protein FA95DRAFT_1199524 [Auriscalpium vulgare]|uniref:Uncharacterized protein n=1 Tax=Auriscalpium vulgare TaxID=40419 RepID=A0ACB8RUU6_9AGAM|nr:hypothetical protein FA95DRAFT_1199524 [Auriscalpium vulgare]
MPTYNFREPDLESVSSHHRECRAFWSSNALSRVSQLAGGALRAVDLPLPAATLKDNLAGDRSLRDVKHVLYTERNNERAAMERAWDQVSAAYTARIEVAEAALLAHRQQHNALVPVSRVPPEILSTVFTFLLDIDPPQALHASNYKLSSTFGWLAVTYVCRHWRQVALQQSSLWSHVTLTFGSQWAATFLSRARNLPISIQVHKRTTDRSAVPDAKFWQLEFLAENMQRTECLHTVDLHDLLALTAPAPLLHTLHLQIDDEEPFSGLFGGCTPALLHLHLSSPIEAPQPWTSSLFTQLVTLDMRYVAPWDDPSALDSILDALEHMSALERLEVKLQIQDEPRYHPLGNLSPHRTVRLARLSYLGLITSIFSCQIFLKCISIAPDTSVECDLYGVRLAEENSTFFQNLLLRVPADTTAEFHHPGSRLSISSIPSQYDGMEILEVTAEGAFFVATLSMKFFLGSIGPSVWITSGLVTTALAACDLRELTISSDAFENEHVWLTSLGHARALRHLTVEGSAAVSLCAALRLCVPSTDIASTGPAPCFLPALAILVLADVRLSVGGEVGDESPLVADALPRCLAMRASAGCVLEELDVMRCDVYEEWVARMREMLPGMRVAWDEGACEQVRVSASA